MTTNTPTGTRPRGAIAHIIDPNTLLYIGRTTFAQAHPDYDAQALRHGPTPQMLLTVNRGELAVINSEGVGHIADDDDTVEVCFTHSMSIIRVRIDLGKLAAAVTDETIDIADGIRTFGSRLDDNHHIWFRRYDPAA
ncbi:hypothetical protein [Microbacterium amylolyticum]|uniref:Uncharacterized protein n=1 Tax=Microbacterium amylolyticum TaxID=936337 RepID=A0ABS4ZKR0_9MICO|nr:hypothetical protein [Microbacterium amylolyticum]MBP2437874.1 hypothetical protein [Microbacterium amylolyticum]